MLVYLACLSRSFITVFLNNHVIKSENIIYNKNIFCFMAEKMTAVWLILLTIIICTVVPVMMIILTSPEPPNTQMILGLDNIFDVVILHN